MKLIIGDNKPRAKHIKLDIIHKDNNWYPRKESEFDFNSECTFLQCMLVIIAATMNPDENMMVSDNICQNGRAMTSLILKSSERVLKKLSSSWLRFVR